MAVTSSALTFGNLLVFISEVLSHFLLDSNNSTSCAAALDFDDGGFLEILIIIIRRIES